MDINYININEISNYFLEFLIHKSKTTIRNSNIELSLIYQLLDNEVKLKDIDELNNDTSKLDTHENEIKFYKKQLIDIIENEFNSENKDKKETDFPLLKNFKDRFIYFKKGLPTKPYYKTIAYVICIWSNSQKFPYTFIDNDMPNEIKEYSEIKNVLDNKIKLLNSDLSNSTINKKEIYWNFFETLNTAEFLVILGERITLGSSKDILPPSINDCIKSFVEIHSKDNNCKKYGGLTVGARALSKHCHRDQTNKWWGDYTGNTLNKNQLAINILIKLLKSISWINIHKLPHNINVYEIRNIYGYGARWYFKIDNEQTFGKLNSINDINNININYNLEFRGFLEPQDIKGHEKKWRH
ncbi:hypothetical protein BCR32DRAFT_289324 [Anaeromyces robustus]|uniref:Uncharacterized protein n=1 Tax=Anaeromyces robustus TaxID=1754192 RepID=A0A1Y1XP28_9FUNG|nr:hypothetical protein BCR32DRAFT_289324 [Anaeromyces robustus]|eukprot:ORX87503.1 hypothetical protein BCR32DRAFT_289324 [Anaeromyces robustus]